MNDSINDSTIYKNKSFFKNKNMYRLYKNEINKRNYKMLLYVSLSLLLLGLLFLLVNWIFHVFNDGTKYIYIFWISFSCLCLACCVLLYQWFVNHATAILYIFLSGIMMSMIISGTYFYRENASAIMIGCIASMPILIFDELWRFYLFDFFICILFIIFSFITKSFSISIIDCVNTLTFCFISCMIGMYTIRLKLYDVKSKYQMMEQLQTDQLTGLMSRNAIIKEIESYYKSENRTSGALFIIDIDHFKKINDTFGHLQGDRVLIEFAQIIRENFRESDYMARLGGDEFLVFAKDIDNIETIKEIAERLNQKVRKEITLMENHIYLTVSTGIVLSKRFTNFEELYILADKMLYEVKEKNKNGYKIYNNN